MDVTRRIFLKRGFEAATAVSFASLYYHLELAEANPLEGDCRYSGSVLPERSDLVDCGVLENDGLRGRVGMYVSLVAMFYCTAKRAMLMAEDIDQRESSPKAPLIKRQSLRRCRDWDYGEPIFGIRDGVDIDIV